MKASLLDYMLTYMSDGKTHRLINIVDGVHKMGWVSRPASRYIQSYQELREHPELFERVGRGLYRMISGNKLEKNWDYEEIREMIFTILKKNGSMTTTKIWHTLRNKGFIITYKEVSNALQSDIFFDKTSKSEYTWTRKTKYSPIV